MVRTEHVLDSWKSIREDTALAVEDFPASDMDFRVTPETQSFGEIAAHILLAGQGLTGMLLAGEEDFTVPDFRQRMVGHAGSAPRTSTELAGALRESLDRRLAELASRPAGFYSHIITRFDGQKVTRLEMVQTIKEHELTHRAQLFLCLRLKGVVPSTTRRRLAKQKGQ